jgi:hypothetical protein
MLESDRAAFVVAIEALAATLRQETSQALFTGYWLGLKDLPLANVQAAVARALRQCKFMPSVSELRELAGEMRPDQRAVVAWDAFYGAVRTVGWYGSVRFDDPVIHATVRNLGGWCKVIERIEDEDSTDKWVRKDFERVYQALAETGIGAEQAQPLIGHANAQNALKGHHEFVEEPVLITTGLPALPGMLPAANAVALQSLPSEDAQ